MADEPKPGRAKPVPERFEAFETDPTSHLTDVQKAWKPARLRPATDQFAVLSPQSVATDQRALPPPAALTLKLYLGVPQSKADPVVLAADIYGLVQALSETERDLGGGGLTLISRQLPSDAVLLLTLRHAVAEGANQRARNSPHCSEAPKCSPRGQGPC